MELYTFLFDDILAISITMYVICKIPIFDDDK